MKCPKCNEEIEDNAKFCTKCGVNILEEKAKKAEEERRKQKELEIKEKEAEDKKRLEEIRKQEEQKKEEEMKEAEKAEAIRKAKEEGIEFEIIDKKTEEKIETKKEQNEPKEKNKKEKKKKIKLKKNIFQVLLNKIIFMIIIAAIIIGGVYYCHTQNMLPEFAEKEVGDFEKKVQNIIKLNKEIKENNNKSEKTETKKEWEVDPEIEADNIKDLNKEVSIIVKQNKEGLIDNKTGKVVLEPKYTAIFDIEYYENGKTEIDKKKGIVVKDIEKYYVLDERYQIGAEVTTIIPTEGEAYFYDHHNSIVYASNNASETAKIKQTKEKNLKVCIDIDLVTTEGIVAKDNDLPENFIIDFSKSKLGTKGYCDTSKGELVINCDYDEANEFSEGFAAVKSNGKAGIIDEKGNKIVELKYNQTRSVHNGLAFAEKDGKWGILKIK